MPKLLTVFSVNICSGPQQAQQIQSSGEDITFTFVSKMQISGLTTNCWSRENDIIIAIMGVTGAGKSTFIALLCDEEIEIGHGLQSCESFCEFKYLREGAAP
jgi:ABC-type proline/glycine betaine transport system ATPase subunit